MSAEEVKALTKNYSQLQHDVNGLRQTANLNSEDLRDIKYALLGNEDFNQDGLVTQFKKHAEKHAILEKKVADIEKVKEIEDKLITYKKGLFYTLFGTIGAGVLALLKAFGTFIFEHFKF